MQGLTTGAGVEGGWFNVGVSWVQVPWVRGRTALRVWDAVRSLRVSHVTLAAVWKEQEAGRAPQSERKSGFTRITVTLVGLRQGVPPASLCPVSSFSLKRVTPWYFVICLINNYPSFKTQLQRVTCLPSIGLWGLSHLCSNYDFSPYWPCDLLKSPFPHL